MPAAGAAQLPDAAVAERARYLTLAVRDYLNEGGKLLHDGETTGYTGTLGRSLGGIHYGLNGDPTADCAVTEDPRGDCLLLADDFQHYVGASSRSTTPSPTGFEGRGDLEGVVATFSGAALTANPLDEAGTFTVTSDLLPAERFPQFASEAAGTCRGSSGGAFDPVEGSGTSARRTRTTRTPG